jgi:membrane protease YdiL (CAAX protease family)
MSGSARLFGWLALLVLVWYLALTYLPIILGSCFDGVCSFTPVEIATSFAIPLASIALTVALEMRVTRHGLGRALSDIGVTRFSWTGIRLAAVYLAPLVAYFPVVALATGSALSLREHWVWFVLSAIVINGLAEEMMMRGFVFRRFRERDRFWRAAVLSTILFAGYHLLNIVFTGVVIGIIGVMFAILLGLLTAYIYERGDNTIAGPGLLHAVNNVLVFIIVLPPELQTMASAGYLLLGVLVSSAMIVWAYRTTTQHPNLDRVGIKVTTSPVSS